MYTNTLQYTINHTYMYIHVCIVHIYTYIHEASHDIHTYLYIHIYIILFKQKHFFLF